MKNQTKSAILIFFSVVVEIVRDMVMHNKFAKRIQISQIREEV